MRECERINRLRVVGHETAAVDVHGWCNKLRLKPKLSRSEKMDGDCETTIGALEINSKITPTRAVEAALNIHCERLEKGMGEVLSFFAVAALSLFFSCR